MSRLAARIRRLEERSRGCPGCAKRPPLIEIVSPSRRSIAGKDTDTGPCPDCGEPRELLIVHFAFDCFPEEPEDPPRGSVQWERAQEAKRRAPRS